MENKNIVRILKDGDYSIFLAKDNYKGIAVQTCMKVNQLVPNSKKELVNHRTQTVIVSDYIPYRTDEGKKNDKFVEHLQNAIKHAREKVSELKGNDQEMDKILDQYREAHKKLNEPEENS